MLPLSMERPPLDDATNQNRDRQRAGLLCWAFTAAFIFFSADTVPRLMRTVLLFLLSACFTLAARGLLGLAMAMYRQKDRIAQFEVRTGTTKGASE